MRGWKTGLQETGSPKAPHTAPPLNRRHHATDVRKPLSRPCRPVGFGLPNPAAVVSATGRVSFRHRGGVKPGLCLCLLLRVCLVTILGGRIFASLDAKVLMTIFWLLIPLGIYVWFAYLGTEKQKQAVSAYFWLTVLGLGGGRVPV